MLNGLEIKERNLLAVRGETEEFRIDSQFHKKEYLAAKEAVEKAGAAALENDASLSILHPMEIQRNYVSNGGVWFLRAQNLRPMRIDDANKVFVSDEDAKTLSRNLVRKGDLLVTRTGAVGASAVFEKGEALASSHIFMVRQQQFCNYYLAAYLNCRYGQQLIARGMYGGLQPEISQTYLKNAPVYRASEALQCRVRQVMLMANKAEADAAEMYGQANATLLSNLRLDFSQLKKQKNTVKSFRDSFGASGRLDAEYYHPRYEYVEKKLRKFKVVRLQEICSAINYGTVPTSPYTDDGSGVPYIKGLNLKRGLVVTDKLDRITNTKELRPRYYTKSGDLLISQMGTVGNCGVVSGEQAGWVFASFTIRARIENQSLYPPHFLALYINAVAKPYYFLREIAQASVRQNTTLPIVRNMPVPVLPTAVQNSIDAKLQESHRLRAHAQKLMDDARQAVEIAIEKGEKEALAFLKNCAK